jgi:cell division protein FtsL
MNPRSANIGLGVLFTLVVASALAVVCSKHESRKLFIQLQGQQVLRDELSFEWGRLQLEQSTWAAHGRIESIAAEHLHMRLPAVGAIVAVEP